MTLWAKRREKNKFLRKKLNIKKEKEKKKKDAWDLRPLAWDERPFPLRLIGIACLRVVDLSTRDLQFNRRLGIKGEKNS